MASSVSSVAFKGFVASAFLAFLPHASVGTNGLWGQALAALLCCGAACATALALAVGVTLIGWHEGGRLIDATGGVSYGRVGLLAGAFTATVTVALLALGALRLGSASADREAGWGSGLDSRLLVASAVAFPLQTALLL
jgi:hypothetical protein